MKRHDNNGLRVERRICRQFHGKECSHYCIDFTTQRCAYEVKSCQLLQWVTNSNHKRPHKGEAPHRPCRSTHRGRFVVKRMNHVALKVTADDFGLEARYVFVVEMGRQLIMKVVPWQDVNQWMNSRAEVTLLSLRCVWGREIK